MLYDAVCHANLQSVIRYPYPIRGIVENDIRIYLYPQKITDIRKYLSAVLRAPLRSALDQSHLGLFRTSEYSSSSSSKKLKLYFRARAAL